MQSANGGDTALMGLPANSTGGQRKKRIRYTKEQVDVLVRVFEDYRYPGIELREALTRKIGVDESRIHVWFQNRRARHPLKKKEDAMSCGMHSNQQSAPNLQHLHDGSLEGQFYGPRSQDLTACVPGAGNQSTCSQVPQVLHGPVLQCSLGTEAQKEASPQGHNPSLCLGTGITPPPPSPYVGIPPPPASPSTGIFSPPYCPNTGNILPPAAPYTNQALPQQATPIFYGQQIQGSHQCTSLPLLTEDDLTILQLPAGSYQF